MALLVHQVAENFSRIPHVPGATVVGLEIVGTSMSDNIKVNTMASTHRLLAMPMQGHPRKGDLGAGSVVLSDLDGAR